MPYEGSGQGLGWLVGLGRAVGAETERQQQLAAQQEARDREDQKQATERYTRYLENLFNSDDVPGDYKEPILNNLMTLVTTPGGVKKKDLEKIHKSVFEAINAPRPVLGDQDAIDQIWTPKRDAMAGAMGASGLLGGEAFGSAIGGMVPPRPRTTSGLVTPQERANFNRTRQMVEREDALGYKRRELEMQNEFRPDRYQILKGTDGMYSFENGKFMEKTPFPAEAQGVGNTFETPRGMDQMMYNTLVSRWQQSNPGQRIPEDVLLDFQRQSRRETFQADDYPWQHVGPTNTGVVIVDTERGPMPVGVNIDRLGRVISLRGDDFYTPDGTAVTAGIENISAGPPPGVPMGVQQDLAALQTLNKQVEKIRTIAPNGKVGPVAGRIANVQMKYLGGMQLTPEEKQVSVWLQEMFATKGFDEGGKQLTGPEREIFAGILPSSSDTVETIMVKLNVAQQRLDMKLGSIVNSMPNRQSQQITNVPGASSVVPQRKPQMVAPVGAGGAPAPSPAPSPVPAPAPAPAGLQIGQIVKLRDGRRILVKEVQGTKITKYEEVP